ncbi:MAG: GH1 family beta-glucosidase [Acidimicrobiales bacterium]|jgi:beta-glucosidase
MTDRLFPEDFLWGVATSAYQIEGAVDEDGRTPSIWDTFSHRPGKTRHGDTGDVACDHYHRLEEDVELMASLGIRAYRFSVAWPRIFPNGKPAVNQIGLDFYSRLVDALRAHEIEPYVTLYHWDLPQPLEEAGGWLNRDTAYRLEDLARVVADALGDRVNLWSTVNEPWVAAFVGYSMGQHAPGLAEMGAGILASHHLLLGHGLAARAITETIGSSALVGPAVNQAQVIPASDSEQDLAAARRYDDHRNRWFLDPMLLGSYPAELLEEYTSLVGDDFLHDGDLEIIHADIGFVGVNYYSPNRIAAATKTGTAPTRSSSFGEWVGTEDRSRTDVARTTMGWTIEPEGLTEILVRIRRDYGDIPMYVTENGAAFYDYVDPTGTVRDTERIEYLRGHFAAAHAAMAQGVDLRGYFVWSLCDNFEWAEGFAQRFGLVFTDYRTQERILKQSAHFYREVIATNAVNA